MEANWKISRPDGENGKEVKPVDKQLNEYIQRWQMNVKLVENTIDRKELHSLCQWLESGAQLTKGSLTVEFENEFAKYVGSKYAVFVNSGSSANLLAYYALLQTDAIKSVVVPAISWVTTVSPALQFGLNVHLCDCDPFTLGLDLNHLEWCLQKHRPDAVVCVHVLGHPNDMHSMVELCSRYNAILIEDSCEAFGTTVEGRHVGTYGKCGTFSFYYGHQISTIEGGMLVTDDRNFYNYVKSLRAHGWSRDVDPDIGMSWESEYAVDECRSLYTFYYPGFNCRSTDLNAFLGLSQLKKAESVIAARHDNFLGYCDLLGKKYWVQKSKHNILSSFAFGTLVENRLDVFRHLRVNGIESRPLICGSIGRQPFWIRFFGTTPLPNADVVHEKGIYLPNHPLLDKEAIKEICRIFQDVAIPCDVWGDGSLRGGDILLAQSHDAVSKP